MLLHEGKSIDYIREKLNEGKQIYSTYYDDFDGMVRARDPWSHYLRYQHFIFHSDDESLKYICGQHKLNVWDVKRAEFLQYFNFSSKI